MSQQSQLSFLQRRAIVPRKTFIAAAPVAPAAPTARTIPAEPGTPDLDNVQGDVYFMFPKKWESFLFFKITDTAQFSKDLAKYVPLITSSRQTAQNILDINDYGGSRKDIVSTGIAFARAGLGALGIHQELGDPHFDKGSLVLEKTDLGDSDKYDDLFDTNAKTHGVILLAAREQQTCRDKMDEIKRMFSNSITVEQIHDGRVRAGDGEHFGWRDGISQPAIDCDWAEPKPGQRVVKPGVIIMGYPGDPIYDSPDELERPEFTKDGSFMVFRKLEQNVLFFEDYIDNYWASVPAQTDNGIQLSDEQRKALFEARLFGRFKSGVPLALSPYLEDPNFLTPDRINNFDYSETSGRCPFAAHIRKTAARNLQPIISKEFLDASVIVRAGIPYGPEVSDEEQKKWETLNEQEKESAACDRGLLFVCYQSSIHNGFYRQTTGFARNDFFPLTGLTPQKSGQDRIIGGPQPVQESSGEANMPHDGQVTLRVMNTDGIPCEVSGVVKTLDTSATTVPERFFVTSRGGEYYFVPSISTVKEWANAR